MTRSRFIRRSAVVVALFLVAALLAGPVLLQADQAQYFYDALGRLSAVVDGQGNVAFYNYDAVGNLISITRTGPAAAPTLTAVSPATIDAGTSTNVTITGTGFQFPSVKTSNPDIQISNVVTTSISITATFTIANPTTFGLVTVTVKTLGGTASTSLTVRQATPNITQLTPDGGVVGTTVVIAGTGFGTKAGSNHVTFAGLGGVRLAATVGPGTASNDAISNHCITRTILFMNLLRVISYSVQCQETVTDPFFLPLLKTFFFH